MRACRTAIVRNEVTRNPFVWGALALCAALILVVLHVPPLAAVLALHPLSAEAWALVAGASLTPWAVGQIAETLPGESPRQERAAA